VQCAGQRGEDFGNTKQIKEYKMKCRECKKDVPQGSGYCPYCGTPLNPHTNPQSYPRANTQTYPLKVRNALGVPVLTFNVNGVDFNMVKVEKGSFYRGSSLELIQDYIKRGQDWKQIFPLVTLNTFFIGETPVTQALWEAVMYEKDDHIAYWDQDKGIFNPSRYKGKELPVDLSVINFATVIEFARKFIKKLNEITGWGFDFPTNDQWEFAARGGNMSKGYKYAGSNNIDEVAWYCENSVAVHQLLNPVFKKDPQPHPVKTKLPNELGIYDMSGNADELCYLNPSNLEDYYMQLRGGSCGSFSNMCEIISIVNKTGRESEFYGFRLVLNKPAKIEKIITKEK
jgi:formylglycine-generating enzyme required for sulfatase activity